jgi:hypothetical protein
MKKIVLSIIFLILLSTNSFAQISVLGELTRKYVVKPGGVYEGTIVLRNKGDKPHDVKIKKKDYLFDREGKNRFEDPPIHPRSNSDWISVSPSKASIPPGESLNVSFKIHIPQKEDLSGSYWSILMVEPLEPIVAETLLRSENKKLTMSLKVVIQHAVQIITDIGDTGTTKIKFVERKIVNKEGKRFIQIDIENVGERWVTFKPIVEIFDQDGKSIGKFEANRARIFPTCSARFFSDISEVPKGKYKALIVTDDFGEKVFGTRMNLNIED